MHCQQHASHETGLVCQKQQAFTICCGPPVQHRVLAVWMLCCTLQVALYKPESVQVCSEATRHEENQSLQPKVLQLCASTTCLARPCRLQHLYLCTARPRGLHPCFEPELSPCMHSPPACQDVTHDVRTPVYLISCGTGHSVLAAQLHHGHMRRHDRVP